MKMHLVAVVGLAISFAVPTFAQEQNTVDPEVRQQIKAVLTDFDEAYKKHDAAAIAGLFTQDAIQVWDFEGGATVSGQQAIEKMFADDFAKNPGKMVNTIVQVYPIRNDNICAIINTSVGPWKGRAVQIYVRDAGMWKIRMTYKGESTFDVTPQ